MSSLTRARTALAALAAALAMSHAAVADQPGDAALDIADMTRSADLIFRGSVRAVEHRVSEPDAETPAPVPHTFVTYDVDEVIKGAVEGAQITLRFFGGPLGPRRFALLAHTPLFDVGDRDLLLVQGNLQNGCPLVACPEARFRMIDDLVVSELGQLVRTTPDDRLSLGRQLFFDEVAGPRMSDTIVLERRDLPAAGQAELLAAGDLDPERDPTPERFAELVARVVARVHTPEELARARARPAPSANPKRPFHVTGLRALPPPADPAQDAIPSAAAPRAEEPEAPPHLAASEASTASSGSTRSAPDPAPEASAVAAGRVPLGALAALGLLGALALWARAWRARRRGALTRTS